jgi:hypothetical protein
LDGLNLSLGPPVRRALIRLFTRHFGVN